MPVSCHNPCRSPEHELQSDDSESPSAEGHGDRLLHVSGAGQQPLGFGLRRRGTLHVILQEILDLLQLLLFYLRNTATREHSRGSIYRARASTKRKVHAATHVNSGVSAPLRLPVAEWRRPLRRRTSPCRCRPRRLRATRARPPCLAPLWRSGRCVRKTTAGALRAGEAHRATLASPAQVEPRMQARASVVVEHINKMPHLSDIPGDDAAPDKAHRSSICRCARWSLCGSASTGAVVAAGGAPDVTHRCVL